MSEIEISSLTTQDIPYLERIDHSFHTEFVWQMEVSLEAKDISIRFKEVRLPRSMKVEYPRNLENFSDLVEGCEWVFVAHKEGEPIGYASVLVGNSRNIGKITNLAVTRRLRKQGIGTALVLTVQDWLVKHGINHIQLEMQSKNFPAISMANKLGFEFCGYSDCYYPNQDIAIFFGRRI